MQQKGVENFKRREWSKEEYERLALEREDRERSGVRQLPSKSTANTVQTKDDDEDLAVDTSFAKLHYADIHAAKPQGSSKAFLDVSQARTRLNLEAKVGKVEKVAGGARQAGYYCDLCDRTYQDSIALLDHINSREHQSRLGFSMQIAPSTKSDVKSRLQHHLKKAVVQTATAAKSSTGGKTNVPSKETLEDRLKIAEEEIEKEKQAKAAKRKKQKLVVVNDEADQDEETAEEINPELQAMLGFSSFGK